ncbi:MAG: glutamine synthetase beta-grasp domain-containing protein, partial [Erysipelotrichaceae bacterium]|nr:glutamine synthetase beta-grasp domain-containing protein [Erysipelotrichaceae bacterium]
MFKDIKEVQNFIKEKGVRFVDFKMIDLKGRWKHLSIPAENFKPSIMEEGIGFDGSNYGYADVKNSDMVFIPDLKTAVIDPFVEETTLTMMGDVYVIRDPENIPFDQYPRNIVRNAINYLKETGIGDEMIIGPEYEFHVFDSVSRKVSANESFYKLTSTESHWSASD